MKNQNINILEHIISHCTDIKNDIIRFGNSFKIFSKDDAYQRIIYFSIIQILWLMDKLSDKFVKENEIRTLFKRIIDLHNSIVPGYITVDFNIIWEIVNNDIPQFEAFCKEKLVSTDHRL